MKKMKTNQPFCRAEGIAHSCPMYPVTDFLHALPENLSAVLKELLQAICPMYPVTDCIHALPENLSVVLEELLQGVPCIP